MSQVVTIAPWDSSKIEANRITSTAEAYERIPLIFRAVHLRCSALARIPFRIVDMNDNELDAYQFEDSLPMHDLLFNAEFSLLLEGWAHILKLKNGYNSIKTGQPIVKGLQWLNPYTVFSILSGNELLYWQQLSTGERFPKNQDYWREEDFIYFREFNPRFDLGAGVSATQVALDNAQIAGSLTKFLGNFFGADALPVTMVVMPANTKPDERERVENWFRDKLTKLRKAVARVIGVTGDVKIERLTQELKTFEFEKIDKHALDAICYAFSIPQSLMNSEADSYATANVAMRNFMTNTVVPRSKYFEERINDFLQDYGQKIEFEPEELPEMQEDEASRAVSLKNLVDAGLPLQAALDALGYDFSDDVQKILDAHFKLEAEKRLNPPAPPPQLGPAVDPQGNLVTISPPNGKPH